MSSPVPRVVRGVEGTPKTKATIRQLQVPDLLAEMLTAQRTVSKVRLCREPLPEDYVFCGPKGRPLNVDSTRRKVLQPALLAAGIPPQLYAHGWHLLRHSAGNGLGDVYATSRLLGHASVKITEATYMHLGPKVSETEKLAEYWKNVPEVCPASVPRNPKFIQ